jgi:hypothetical protein
MWFIFSEVMFFAAFFGALFYARALSVPWLGGEGHGALTNFYLWPNFSPAWPTNGPGDVGGQFETMAPWGIPLLNTLLLLSSGVTITIAHHALRAGNRKVLMVFLALTIILGFTFLGFQAHEYIEAYTKLNLTSRSRRWPGTGTSSTWCGSGFSCSCTCSEAKRAHLSVVPAKAGTQRLSLVGVGRKKALGPRLRGDDENGVLSRMTMTIVVSIARRLGRGRAREPRGSIPAPPHRRG